MCRCRKRYKCPSLRRVPQAQEPQDATERTTVKAPSSRQGLSARLFRLQTRCHRCHSLTSLVQAFQAVTERYTTAEVFASVNTYSSRIDARNALKSLQVFACFGTLQKKRLTSSGSTSKAVSFSVEFFEETSSPNWSPTSAPAETSHSRRRQVTCYFTRCRSATMSSLAESSFSVA